MGIVKEVGRHVVEELVTDSQVLERLPRRGYGSIVVQQQKLVVRKKRPQKFDILRRLRELLYQNDGVEQISEIMSKLWVLSVDHLEGMYDRDIFGSRRKLLRFLAV